MILCLFLLYSTLGLSLESTDVPLSLESKGSLMMDEIEAISSMVVHQRKKLITLQELEREIRHFKLLKQQFNDGKQDQRHALQMVLCAKDLLNNINHEHIAHLFSEEFLKDLVFFSSIADKSRAGPP